MTEETFTPTTVGTDVIEEVIPDLASVPVAPAKLRVVKEVAPVVELTYRVVQALPSERLEDFTYRVLGKESRWMEIVALNTKGYPPDNGDLNTVAIKAPNYWITEGNWYRVPVK